MDNIDSSDFIKILDTIGNHGPLLTFLFTAIGLFMQKKYLTSYVLFAIVNHFLNTILKMLIKQPRPQTKTTGNTDIETRWIELNEDKYGMPSYHAQMVFFSTTFLYLVKSNPFLLIAELAICFLTLHQRWKYKRHDIPQLTVGSIIGVGVACLAYYLTNHYLSSQ